MVVVILAVLLVVRVAVLAVACGCLWLLVVACGCVLLRGVARC